MSDSFPLPLLLPLIVCAIGCWFLMAARRKLWAQLAKSNGRIFISYRRKNSLEIARNLKRDFDRVFGPDAAFLDEGSIDSGDDYPPAIRRSLQQSDVVFVLVEKDWDLNRFQDASDWVADEIKNALDLGICVPVRIDGCEMPKIEELPQSISSFTNKQALVLCRDKRYEVGFPLLEEEVRRKSKALVLAREIRSLDILTMAGSLTFVLVASLVSVFWSFQPQLDDLDARRKSDVEALDKKVVNSQRTYPFSFSEFLERKKLDRDLKDVNVEWDLVVKDVLKDDNGNVAFSAGNEILDPSTESLNVTFEVSAQLKDRVSTLKKGDKIRVVGQISSFESLLGTLVEFYPLDKKSTETQQ